jgi:hypothetical protein
MTAEVLDLQALLHKPIDASTPGQRLTGVLGGTETAAFTALSFGDVVYDRFSIDPNALEAFHFVNRITEADIYRLATWSSEIEHRSLPSFTGEINNLKGSVFERVAAASLRQSGAHVVFPTSQNNAGWDFLVNGEPVQAKCGVSAALVTEHMRRYPDMPRMVVSENLGARFVGHDHITPIPGASEDMIRATTEHSLHSAANLLELHLLEIIPVILVARNAYAWLRGETDWAAIAQNLAVDGSARYLGAKLGHAAGMALAVGLGGWPAVLLPVATTVVGFRTARGLSDQFKQHVFLRSEFAELMAAIESWCRGAVTVLDRAIQGGTRDQDRFARSRSTIPAIYHPMVDDWLHRLAIEQDDRRFHRNRFARAADDPQVFGADLKPAMLAANAALAAARAGILPFDLVSERKRLIAACNAYAGGLKRRLLRS